MLIPILFVGLCIAVLYFYGTKRMVNLISGIQGSIRGTLGGTADMAYVFLEARWPLISPYHKHFMLFLTSAIMFGSSVGYDSPGALHTKLKDWLGKPYETFQYEFNLMYAIYSFPNILLPLYTSTFINKLGLNNAMGSYTFIVFLGVFVYCVGVTVKLFSIMLLGRGVGSESLTIIQSTIINKFFIGRDLSFAFSVTATVGRLCILCLILGSVFDYAVLPVILEHSSFLICTWFGTFVSIFSLGCAGAIAIFDQLIGSKEKVVPPSKEEEKEEGSSDSIEMAISLKQRAMSISRNDLDSGSSSVEKRLAITIPSQSRSMRSPLSPTIVFSTNSPMVSPTLVFKTGPWYNQLMPEGISTLPESFWLLTISFISFSVVTLNFLPLSPAFLQAKYFRSDPTFASQVASIPDTLSLLLIPLFGWISDQFQYPSLKIERIWKTRQILAGGLCLFSAHYLMGFTSVSPFIGLSFLSIGYSMYGSVLYSLMADVVSIAKTDSLEKDVSKGKVNNDDERLALAYGVSGCILNATFSFTPILIAWTIISHDDHKNEISSEETHADAYVYMELFLICMAFIGILSMVRLEIVLRR